MKKEPCAAPVLRPLFAGLFAALFVLFLSAKLTGGNFALYASLAAKHPALPDGGIFAPLWFFCCLIEGCAFALTRSASCGARRRGSACYAYFLQLSIAFFYPLLFFWMRAFAFAYIWQLIHFCCAIAMTLLFFRCRKLAGVLLLPCLGFWIYLLVIGRIALG